jgi:hypothetical protein
VVRADLLSFCELSIEVAGGFATGEEVAFFNAGLHFETRRRCRMFNAATPRNYWRDRILYAGCTSNLSAQPYS